MERNRFPSSREELEWEIEDLQSEIDRIRKIVHGALDMPDPYPHLMVALREIRNIVG